ncbi:sensor histidine kinase [Kutzneria albida]|uniref:Sensor-like histidine kinase SenX3 n=1 Tax=Kutzneria albida DSM 43870 TaxID=1449976 RepID=W5WDJ2_9PSEU|nr:HAMP domain-containing sensor histidine kinase [Kutzneria albida]AHH99238.1 hypothetical protein KALB_5877 [Kutzneria albida DSM 43870]
MRWQPGLRTSITLTAVAVTLIATVATALVAYQLQSGATRERFVESARAGFGADAQQAHQFLVQSNSGAPKVDQVAKYMTGRIGLSWAIVNLKPLNGPVATVQNDVYSLSAASPGFSGARPPVSAVEQVRRDPRTPVTYGAGQQVVVLGEVEPDLLVAEYYSTKVMDRELLVLQLQLAAVAGLVILVGTGLGVLAARQIQRRVRTAAAAARELGAGALDTRLPVRGKDELADLAGSFNAMAQRLGESMEQLRAKEQQQQRFVADVAHDLRTPLATMLAATDSLHSTDAEDRSRSAELLGTQVRRLSTLVDDLLEMSRFDAGVADFRPETVDLAALVADAVGLSAPEAGIQVRSVGDVTVHGDPRRLHTIVRNLVSNAVHHGAMPISVGVDGASSAEVRVAVADSGPGLRPDLAPFVFDRFTRGDRARGHTPGSGLGLAIARENAVLHGGRIEVSNSPGAVFVLVLPRGEPDR